MIMSGLGEHGVTKNAEKCWASSAADLFFEQTLLDPALEKEEK